MQITTVVSEEDTLFSSSPIVYRANANLYKLDRPVEAI